jgi:DNA-binding MarR family transcriptional regulator
MLWAMSGALIEAVERLIRVGVAITSRSLSEAKPELELTFPQWRALLVLGERPGGATISEVSARVGVTVPATSRQLRRLARRGLLEMGRDERDRRATRARLSAHGMATLEALLAHRRNLIAAIAADLTVADTTLRDLGRVTDALMVYR